MRNTVSISSLCVAMTSLALVACGSDDGGSTTDPGKAFDVTGGASHPPTGSTEIAPGSGQAVAYPAGPYGTEMGSVVENISWLGWKNGKDVGYDQGAFERVSLSDFYDPDGSKGSKLLIINASAVWCGPCNLEARHMRDANTYATFHAKGVDFLWTLFEDANHDPVKPQDLTNWGNRYAVDYPMVLDPSLKTGAYFATDATPLNFLVDTRTMRIVDIIMGGLLDDAAWNFVNRHL